VSFTWPAPRAPASDGAHRDSSPSPQLSCVFGLRILERVKADLEPYGVVEQFPRLEGRQMVMVLAPKKKVLVTKPKKEMVKQDAPKPAQKQAEKPAA